MMNYENNENLEYNKEKKKNRANEIDKLVSTRIKRRRVILGLTQHDIGKKLGVTIQQVQKYEKAKNRVTSGKLYALANFLKVPISYFFERIDSQHPDIGLSFAEHATEYQPEPKPADIEDKEIVELIRLFYKIKDPEMRKKALNIVAAMI